MNYLAVLLALIVCAMFWGGIFLIQEARQLFKISKKTQRKITKISALVSLITGIAIIIICFIVICIFIDFLKVLTEIMQKFLLN